MDGADEAAGDMDIDVPPRQVVDFLTTLYHGKPKACDFVRFMSAMKMNDDKRASLEDVQSAMEHLKKLVRIEGLQKSKDNVA